MSINLESIPYVVWAPPLLVFGRTAALFASSPIMGAAVLPPTVRVVLGMLVSWFALEAGIPVSLPRESLWPLAFLAEIGVGLTIGLLASLVFALFHTAGAALDSELGFTVAQVFNPFSAAGESTLLANWLDALGTVVFLFLGGVQLLLSAAVQSFKVVPMNVTVLEAGPHVLQGVARAFTGSFLLAIEVAAPIILALLLIDLLGAALGRLLPQLNVLTFNLPVKMWVGLGLVAVFLPALVDAGRLAMGLLGQTVSQTLSGLGGG